MKLVHVFIGVTCYKLQSVNPSKDVPFPRLLRNFERNLGNFLYRYKSL